MSASRYQSRSSMYIRDLIPHNWPRQFWLYCIQFYKILQVVNLWSFSLHTTIVTLCIDVPRPLTNDLWVFLFQTIDAHCVKWASPARTYVYVKAFIVNLNKCLKPFFLEQHINIVNRVTLQSVSFIFSWSRFSTVFTWLDRCRYFFQATNGFVSRVNSKQLTFEAKQVGGNLAMSYSQNIDFHIQLTWR